MLDLGDWSFSCVQGLKKETEEDIQSFDIKELYNDDHHEQNTLINFLYIMCIIKSRYIEVMFGCISNMSWV